MSSLDKAWKIDQVCSNAWPPLRQVFDGDWAIRLSDGLTRRANSVNPLTPQALGLSLTLPLAERLYEAVGQAIYLRVPTFLDPAIDQQLAQLGFEAEAETLSLFGDLDGVPFKQDSAVRLQDHASADWLASKARLSGFDPQQAKSFAGIVSGIGLPAAFAALQQGGRTQALAYGVIQDRLLSIESVVTDAALRNLGYGRRTLESLLRWAQKQGARAVCLQVEAGNPAAITLYRKLGLTEEVYRYHYRRPGTESDEANVS